MASQPALPKSRPLSSAQLPIWHAEVLHRHTPRWTQITVIRLEGAVDAGRLEHAIEAIVARHPALRTRLLRQAGSVSQRFADMTEFRLGCHHRPTVRDNQDAVISEFLAAAQLEHFNLYGGMLFRADLLALAPDRSVLVLRLHHIAADGVALGLLVPQIATAYRDQFEEGRQDPAYENWLDRQSMSPPGLDIASAHYRNALDKAVLCSPAIYDRPDDGERREAPDLLEATVTLGAATCNSLRTLARLQGATLFIALFAAYAAVLRVFARQDDLVIATFVSGRIGERVPIVGNCINTVLVRVHPGVDDTGPAWIDVIKDAWRPVRRHYTVPSSLLTGADGAKLPLAQFAINYLDMNDAAFDLPGVVSSVTHAQQGFPLNDLLLYALREQDNRLRLRLIAGSGTPRLSRTRLTEILDELVCRIENWCSEIAV